MLNSSRGNLIIKEEQKPLVNNYNPWLNRANELLDLSSSDSRDTQGVNDEGGFIPQILMNPWDPQQPPMMTLAPIANAMQQYQQQWLTQYQQVQVDRAGGSEGSSTVLQKPNSSLDPLPTFLFFLKLYFSRGVGRDLTGGIFTHNEED